MKMKRMKMKIDEDEDEDEEDDNREPAVIREPDEDELGGMASAAASPSGQPLRLLLPAVPLLADVVEHRFEIG